MDADAVRSRPYGSEAERSAALEQFYTEVRFRLIEECGWAAVPSLTYDIGYGDHSGHLSRLKQAVGERALVFDWNGEGIYWMVRARISWTSWSCSSNARRRCTPTRGGNARLPKPWPRCSATPASISSS